MSEIPFKSLPLYRVQFEPGLIAGDGAITNEATERFLRQYIEEFAGFMGPRS